ncbi:MAG TPA: type II toxin-antitoxin system VapC family toxin [Marmoricola sp.]|nr:type II toxin-antitoxin system VapC family toxin [Marmoricola sp.]
MILLDTQSLLWLLFEPERIGARSRGQISESPKVYASAISHVEIRIKQALRKIRVPENFLSEVGRAGLVALPMTDRHASALLEFPELVGHDPFDRQILAQAHAEGLTLLTSDRRLLGLVRDWIVDVRR